MLTFDPQHLHADRVTPHCVTSRRPRSLSTLQTVLRMSECCRRGPVHAGIHELNDSLAAADVMGAAGERRKQILRALKAAFSRLFQILRAYGGEVVSASSDHLLLLWEFDRCAQQYLFDSRVSEERLLASSVL